MKITLSLKNFGPVNLAMKAILLPLLAIAVTCVSMQPAQAQQGFDELLKKIKENSSESAKLNGEREARFLRNKSEQQELTRKAEADAQAAQSKVNRIKNRYDANQRTLGELRKKLKEDSAELAQLYAAVRVAASDAEAAADGSLITAQFPKRVEFLQSLANDKALPSLRQLEGFWYLLTEDMVQSGKIIEFEGEVLDVFGNSETQKITRLGPFTAFTKDGYVVGKKGYTELELLPKQPAGKYRRLAEPFSKTTPNDSSPMLIDPSRGVLLAIEVDKPTLLERVDQGGIVGYVILSIGALGLLLALIQMSYLAVVSVKTQKQLGNLNAPKNDNPLGRVLSSLKDEKLEEQDDAELLELKLSEAVIRETPRFERFQTLLKLFVAVAPLLGLLGTVTGMILTFQSITVFGTNDPKLMAGGISQALVTTVLGLVVAVPLLFINNLLASRSRRLTHILDEQSARVLARRLEKANA